MTDQVDNIVRRPVMQCLCRSNLTGIRQNQVCDQMHKICDKVVIPKYVQEISSMGYGIKS